MADRRNTVRLILLLAVAFVAAAGGLKFFLTDRTFSDLNAAVAAFENGDYEAVCEHAERQLQQTPNNEASLRIGAEAAERLNDPALALAFLQQLSPTFDTAERIQSWRTRARILKRLGRVTESCEALKTILQVVPDDAVARRRLCRSFSECGFEFEAAQQARLLVQQQAAELRDLALLARNGRGRISRDQLIRMRDQNPADEMPLVGLLKSAEAQRDAAEIGFLLSEANETIPHPTVILQCHQLAFAVVSDSTDGRTEGIVKRLRKVHHNDGATPEAWLVTADWAEMIGRADLHQACLAKAVRMDRWNSAAIHGLANSLRNSEPRHADRFFDLSQRLQKIEKLASRVEVSTDNTDMIHLLATDLALIGRANEASAWAHDLVRHLPQVNWKHPIDDLADVDAKAMLNELWLTTEAQPTKTEGDIVVMHDCAADVGLVFRYRNGESSGQQGRKMHQWTGGGIGVVDLDHDTWPDLYLSQGGELNARSETDRDVDALFRNLRGVRFVSVERAAGLSESGFGQGVAVGDVNSDGFDDIYVANVGVNRLLTSQGDGTFVASNLATGGEVWTTSVAIADLNQDTNPDLYDVNYLSGAEVFTKTCNHSGRQRICGPTDFSAEPDRLLLSDAAGRYVSVPDLPVGTDGRGMGLLVGAITQGAGNQIYVANDESANQLFVNDSIAPDRFRETAASDGVAFDHYGRSQGSMGIASGDINNDGLMDLFVTNYYAEQNTLYKQQASGFLDVTSPVGLAAPGYTQLGFGCQFLDIQADGLLDLVIANGHLDDFSHEGQPYRMLPQVFLNTTDGHFRPTLPDSDFFRSPALGRALATLDWDRDGRCDFVMGHLDQPVALISNQTPASNPTVVLNLVGTTSSRNAVGATISATANNAQQTSWLTAGDGYQSSNERVVRLALPSGFESGTVTWPDGQQQRVPALAAGSHGVVQGRKVIYRLPR